MRGSASGRMLSSSQREQWLSWLCSGDEPHGEWRDQPVVLDSNVWLSGLLFGGQAERALRLARAHARLISADAITHEVIWHIKRLAPKTPRKFLVALEHGLNELALPVNDDRAVVVRDVKDEPIVRLALQYGAIIVTGDQDILTCPDATAVTIAEFVELFASEKGA